MQTLRTIRLSFALLMSLGFGVCLFAVPVPALADDKGLEFLTRASAAFDAGDYREAAADIEEAMKTGLPKDLSARATFMRAQINERNGLLARALQDYSTALWMDTLSASDRKKAADGKERVIAAMGLNSPQSPTARPASASTGSSAAPPPAAAPNSSGGVFGMFDGLFGSSRPQQPPPSQPSPSQPKPAWQTATAAPPPVEAKVDATEPIRAAAPRKAAKPAPEQAAPIRTASLQPASISTSQASGFLIVFGAAPSEAAGRTKARQIKTQLADILVSRELDVEAASNGQYQITAGPYKAKSAALALCSAMKQRGVACQVTP
jgi:SPOR domain